MCEAGFLLKAFGSRLKEVHMSEVMSDSKHAAMSLTAISAFRKVAGLIPANTPIILESVILPDKIEQEIKLAAFVLGKRKLNADRDRGPLSGTVWSGCGGRSSWAGTSSSDNPSKGLASLTSLYGRKLYRNRELDSRGGLVA